MERRTSLATGAGPAASASEEAVAERVYELYVERGYVDTHDWEEVAAELAVQPSASATLTCARCDHRFVFSADDQEFFASRGYAQPRYCRICRWTVIRTAFVAAPAAAQAVS